MKKLMKKMHHGSIIDQIKPLDELEGGLTMLAYGIAGTGKTVFGASFPKPLLLVDIKEKGTASVTDVPDIEVLRVNAWDQIEELYWFLEKGTKYKSIVLDQMTALQGLGMQKIRADKNMKPTEVFSQRSWGQLSGLMQTWIYNYKELSEKNYNVCFLSHEKLTKLEDDDESDDRIAPQVGAALIGSVQSFLNGAVSVIGNTFVRERYDKKTKENHIEFCMRVGPHAYYHSKVRRPVSAGAPPEVIVNPTYEKIMKISRGESIQSKVKRKKQRSI